MQPEILNQLKSELQSKCVAYDYVDATDNALSDFFINLVQVNKTIEEVNEELVQLVGSDYNPNLTSWFFERKAELENATQAQSQQQQSQQLQQQQQIQEQQQQVQEQQQQVQDQQQQVQEQHGVESMDVAPKAARADRQNRMFTKAIGSVIGSHEKPATARAPRRSSRSRSRSPARQSSRYNTERHISRHDERHSSGQDDRYSRRQDDRNRSSNVFSRLGGSSAQNDRNRDNKPSVFDRLGGSRPIPQPTQNTSRERCKYWPNCKNGDECVYVHPSTVCPDFPNCPKTAVECLFIHPEVSKPVIVQPHIKKLPVPCKFFPYCTNPMCPFIHPVPAQQPFFMQGKPFAASGQRVQVPCKNGDNCTRPDCHFLHPKDPNPQAEVICKFDGACTRPNCFYKHTKENKLINVKQEDTNDRKFSVAEDEVVERIYVGESADIIQNQQQNNTEQQPSTMDMDNDVVMDVN